MRAKLITLTLSALMLLAACTAKAEPSPTPSPTPSPVATPSEASPSPAMENLTPVEQMAAAIERLEPSVTLSLADIGTGEDPEIDVRNIYYSVLSEHPELKYAYDVSITISGDSAECVFSYMPYKTEGYVPPEGSHTIDSLRAAVAQADSMNDGAERLSIAITDPDLLVDDIQRALMQAGCGCIVYTLSPDGTEITASPGIAESLPECAALISDTYELAASLLEDIVSDDDSQLEKIRAVYGYISENVSYDFRYYNDFESMPRTSTVAWGALHDGTAICGGYAHAFKTFLDLLGVESYTVSGVSSGEYHSWNYVVLDGKAYYCDPTADRGGGEWHFMLSEEDFAASGSYEWDADFYARLAA